MLFFKPIRNTFKIAFLKSKVLYDLNNVYYSFILSKKIQTISKSNLSTKRELFHFKARLGLKNHRLL